MTRPLSNAPPANIRATPEAANNRLSAAFDSFETFPALRKSRDAALLEIAGDDRSELVRIVESDPALTVAVLRADGRLAPRDRPTAVHPAVARLSPEALRLAVSSVPVFDFFDQSRTWSGIAEQLRVHAQASQAAVEYVRGALEMGPRPELLAAALLHDIGKLVLLRAYPRYEAIWEARGAPDERLALERTELGIDHAMAGGVLARRLGLANSLARTIEQHHKEGTTGDPAIIRLADMLAHYATGDPVRAAAISDAARAAGLGQDDLRTALDELPGGGRAAVRPFGLSPLTERETEMMRELAQGKVYKQIAHDCHIGVSTVRSHLYNSYRKLGVVDRAQAVLLTTSRGWL